MRTYAHTRVFKPCFKEWGRGKCENNPCFKMVMLERHLYRSCIRVILLHPRSQARCLTWVGENLRVLQFVNVSSKSWLIPLAVIMVKNIVTTCPLLLILWSAVSKKYCLNIAHMQTQGLTFPSLNPMVNEPGFFNGSHECLGLQRCNWVDLVLLGKPPSVRASASSCLKVGCRALTSCCETHPSMPAQSGKGRCAQTSLLI